MKNNDHFKRESQKQLVLFLLIVLFATICFGRVCYLVFNKKKLYSGTCEKCWNQTDTLAEENYWSSVATCRSLLQSYSKSPIRGEIFDDLGRPLRSNYTVFDFSIDGSVMSKKDSIWLPNGTRIALNNTENLRLIIDDLSEQLKNHFYSRYHKSKDYYKEKLTAALIERRNVTILSSNLQKKNQEITRKDTSFLWSLPIIGSKLSGKNQWRCIYLSEQRGRINPYRDVAERAVGNANRAYGIEYEYDSILSGKQAQYRSLYVYDTISKKDKYGNFVRNEKGDIVKKRERYFVWSDETEASSDGCDIHTTINLEIQTIVHRLLLSKLQQVDAEWGTVIVMETNTGEIKAISNLAKISKNDTLYAESFNYALRNSSEPGSTFKLASLISYLEYNDEDTAKQYNLCGCGDDAANKYFGKRMSSDCKRDAMHTMGNAMTIFQRSANAGTVRLVYENHKNIQEYLDHLDALKITAPIKTQLGDIESPYFGKDRGSNRFYQTCFGAGFVMAPMRTLVLYNAVANDGKMLAPLFIKSIAYQKNVLEEFEAEVISEQFCKPSTIEKAQRYLEAVVHGPEGTARKFGNRYPKFAGKTGTRDIYDEEAKGYDYSRNAVSFCGYFPKDEPHYTCIVYLYDVDKWRGTSVHAVDLFANIATQVGLVNHEYLRPYGQQ